MEKDIFSSAEEWEELRQKWTRQSDMGKAIEHLEDAFYYAKKAIDLVDEINSMGYDNIGSLDFEIGAANVQREIEELEENRRKIEEYCANIHDELIETVDMPFARNIESLTNDIFALDPQQLFITKTGAFGIETKITFDSLFKKSYLERSLDQAIKGSYSEEFTFLGLVGEVAIGFTPIGIAADIRDFKYAIETTGDRSFWGNVGAISLATIGFIPGIGELKHLKHLKHMDGAVSAVAKNADEVAGVVAKNADELKHVDGLKHADEVVPGVGTSANSQNSKTFIGKVHGKEIEVPNVEIRAIDYVKRDPADVAVLRKEFDSRVRTEFLGEIAKIDDVSLKNLGLFTDDIARIRAGRVPKNYQVHHKLPLDDGGTNSLDNLVLIKNEPYHIAITNFQNSATKGMNPGDSISMQWPLPSNNIYTGK